MADRTVKEALDSICGLDSEGYAKSALSLSINYVSNDVANEKFEEGKSIVLENTAIEIAFNESPFATVQFMFGSNENPDLQEFWNFYRDYERAIKAFNGSDETPVFTIDATPIEVEGEDVEGTNVFLTLINPIFLTVTTTDDLNVANLNEPINIDTIIGIYMTDNVFVSQEV